MTLLISSVVIAMVLLALSFWALAHRVDATTRAREESVVRNGVLRRQSELAELSHSQAVWDEAIEHLGRQFDPNWVKRNISDYFYAGTDLIFIVDSRGAPRYAMMDGKEIDPARYSQVMSRTQHLLSKIRSGEKARGAPRFDARSDTVALQPLTSTDILDIDGSPFIIIVTLVHPGLGDPRPRNSVAPVVITGERIDKEFIDAFADRFLLSGLHFHMGPYDARNSAHDDEAHVELRDEQGRSVGSLEWSPQKPGSALVRNILAPLLITLAMLSLLAFALYRRVIRTALALRASRADAARAAEHDPLTGLPNRVHFANRLEAALADLRRGHAAVAVFHLDLDDFKGVNDNFGHHSGDELIVEAAQRLAASCRSTDSFARLGGDEFAIVQTPANIADARALATRLVSVMAEPFQLTSARVQCGASVGVALIEEAEVVPAEALRRSDVALYQAKRQGRSRYCIYNTSMDAVSHRKREIAAELRAALLNNELEMVYQPQWHASGSAVGVEAFVRWNSPRHGCIASNTLVTMAEQGGLLGELTAFTLRTAFADSKRWPSLRTAINISPAQLQSETFAVHAAQLLMEVDVPGSRFEFEIQIASLTSEQAPEPSTFAALIGLGFTFALDDFTSNEASLEQLRKAPLSRVKISSSLIDSFSTHFDADLMLMALVKLAAALRLPASAQGIERRDQCKRFTAAGCTTFQGYLFSAPLPADEAEPALLLNNMNDCANAA